MIRRLRATPLKIPFKRSFKHAAAERSVTQSVWVEVESDTGAKGFGEGCPRDYVTGESVASALDFIHTIKADVKCLRGVDDLRTWVASQRERIDAHPSAWCAVELALLDMMARDAAQSVEEMLSMPAIQGPFCYSAVLGSEIPVVFQAQWKRYVQWGFRDFKVKLSGGPDDFERMALLKAAGNVIGSLRFDANNLWREPAVAAQHLRKLDIPFFAVEEPLAPGRYEQLRQIGADTGAKVILDESFLRQEQLDNLRSDPSRWIINLRLSKMGGLLRSLAVAEAAQTAGVALIIGCQVGETSLLSRAALTVAQRHLGRGLLAQEGAFGTHLLASDIIAQPLMFGAGGQLDVSAYHFGGRTGFGLEPVPLPEGCGM